MLKILPCLDSAELGEARRRELDIPRELARDLGISAVAAGELGYYHDTAGNRVDWSRYVAAALAAKVSLPPDAPLPEPSPWKYLATWVQVSNETTHGAARRLVERGLRPLALNFANGIQPGGGFLGGARAQEESLCRSSALYHTLVGDPMYAAHLQRPLSDSSDWAIYSPEVPVFRGDDGRELSQPWLLSYLTAAAPVAYEVGRTESAELLARRIRRVLAIARAYRHRALVLGAWGCGAFGNDSRRTAEDFRAALIGELAGAFSDIVFAITDWSPQRLFLGPFRDVFHESP